MKFYRYEIINLPNGSISLRTYDLLKETEKGYWIWISNYQVTKRWVSKTGKKRYAYPTLEQAKENFIKRTKRRMMYAQNQIDGCKTALESFDYQFPDLKPRRLNASTQ